MHLPLATAAGVAASVLAAAAQAQSADAFARNDTNRRTPLSIATYGRWNSLGPASLTSDGRWMAYVVSPNVGEPTLTIRSIDTDAAIAAPGGTDVQFSDDGKWAGYLVAVPRGRAERSPARRFELVNLGSQVRHAVSDVESFRFSKGSGFVALKTARPAEQAFAGTTLRLRQLATGMEQSFADVDLFAFDADGKQLAFTVDAKDRADNGVYVRSLGIPLSEPSELLAAGALAYDGLAWHGSRPHLAVLRGEKRGRNRHRDNAVLVWTDLGTPQERLIELDPAIAGGIPGGFVISELAPPRFAEAEARLYLGLKQQEAEPARSVEQGANVDVWHWRDDDVQARQIILLPQERRSTQAAVLLLDSRRLVVTGDSAMRSITPAARGRWAVGRTDTAYRAGVDWIVNRADYFRVDQETGERRVIDRSIHETLGISPDGKWFVYTKGGRIHAYHLDSARRTVLAPSIEFSDSEATGGGIPAPVHGLAGWTPDGSSVVLNHAFDLLVARLDGSSVRNLTGGVGAAQQIRFRVARLDHPADAHPVIDLTQPLILSAAGRWTKKTGYYRLDPGGTPIPLLYVDRQIGNVRKASQGDRIVFTGESATEFPDYWVSSTRFDTPRRITDVNPFLAEYAWTPRRMLVEYRNRFGERLQGTLTLPANYQAGRRYPMIVYIYERRSEFHNEFRVPQYSGDFHGLTYASNGYLVLEPDISYELGRPGASALDAVTAATKQVVALGYADPKRIGLYGRSWGGYQAAYIVSQTPLFAAATIGSAYVNLVSMYNTVYKTLGWMVQGAVEVGQIRMGENVTPWSAPGLYASQSPITHAGNVRTPMLMMHGTADQAVDYTQALEWYGAARRLGKSAILLSYPNERHRLGRRENQIDFEIRMKQFFDHYLRNAPAPAWMTEGVSQSKKGM